MAVTVATVNDGESAPGVLVVTATGLPTGIAVSNIVNTNGTITAALSATSAAALGNNIVTLTVTDGALTATATLTVTVTNQAPTILPLGPFNLTQNAAASVVAVATVFDNLETAPGNLVVTATSVPNGIAVANIFPYFGYNF